MAAAGGGNKLKVSAKWEGETAQGCVNNPDCVKNPQFLLTVGGSDEVDLSFELLQVPENGFHAIGMIVATKEGKRIDKLYASETVARTPAFRPGPTVSCSARLGPGRYTILPSTFDAGQENPFELVVDSSSPDVTLEELPPPEDPFAKYSHVETVEAEWAGALAGGCLNYATCVNNPQWTVMVSPDHGTADVDLCVVLTQMPPPGASAHPISITIGNVGGTRIDGLSTETRVATSGAFTNLRQVTCEASVAPQAEAYTVLCSTFEPGQESPFTVQIYATAPIEVAALAGVLTADGRPEGFPYRATADGIWAGNSAGGCTNFPSTCEGNPQFFLHVHEEPTRLLVELTQTGPERHPIGFVIADKGGRRIHTVQREEAILVSGKFTNDRKVSAEVLVEPRPHPYTIFVSTYSPALEGTFCLDVFSDVPLGDGGDVGGAGDGAGPSSDAAAAAQDDTAAAVLPPAVDITPGDLGFEYHAFIESEWTAATAGGCINNPSAATNPQFFLAAPEGGRVVIELTQAATERLPPPAIGVAVVDKDGQRVENIFHGEIKVDSGPYKAEYRVSGEGVLAPSATPYTVFPTTFNPGELARFAIHVWADTPVELSAASAYEDPLADLVHRVEAASAWRGPTAGGCLNFAAGCRSPQFLLHVPAGGGGGGGGGGEPVRVSVVLEQDGGGSGGAFHPIGVLVARAGGGPIRELKASDQVLSSGTFAALSQTTASGTLVPSEVPYTVFASTFAPGDEANFTVTVFSDVPGLRLEPVADVAPAAVTGYAFVEEVTDAWELETAGGSPNFPTAPLNPQWQLFLDGGAEDETDTEVTIELRQHAPDALDKAWCSIGALLLDNGGVRMKRLLKGQMVASTGNYAAVETVSLTATLAPKLYPYVIFVSTFAPFQDAAFTVRVHANKAIRLEALPKGMPATPRRPRNRPSVSRRPDSYRPARTRPRAHSAQPTSRPASIDHVEEMVFEVATEANPGEASDDDDDDDGYVPRRRATVDPGADHNAPALPPRPAKPRRRSVDVTALSTNNRGVAGKRAGLQTPPARPPTKPARNRGSRNSYMESRALPMPAPDGAQDRSASPPVLGRPARQAAVGDRIRAYGGKPLARPRYDSTTTNKARLSSSLPASELTGVIEEVRAEKGGRLRGEGRNGGPSARSSSSNPDRASSRRSYFEDDANYGSAKPTRRATTDSPSGSLGVPVPRREYKRRSSVVQVTLMQQLNQFSATLGGIDEDGEGEGEGAAGFQGRREQPAVSRQRAATIGFGPAPPPRKGTLPASTMDLLVFIGRIFSDSSTEDDILGVLLHPEGHLVSALATNALIKDSEALAMPLIGLFESDGRGPQLIRTLLAAEVARTSTSQTASFLRGSSLTSKVLATYSRIVGTDYLRSVLEAGIAMVEAKPAAFTLDRGGEYSEAKVQYVIDTCDAFLEAILDHPENCPEALRVVCYYLKQETADKFPEHSKRIVGGHLFLRFICPAIVTPHEFGLREERPPRNVSMGLIFVSKVLQRLANNGSFPESKSYAEVINGYMGDKEASLRGFVETLPDIDIPPPIMASAQAMFEFEPDGPDELRLRVGDTVYEVEETDAPQWLVGRIDQTYGLFPSDFVDVSPAEEGYRTTPTPLSAQERSEYFATIRQIVASQQSAIMESVSAPFQTSDPQAAPAMRQNARVRFRFKKLFKGVFRK